MHNHQSHEPVVKRLKRARGHLDKVISMIEEGNQCTDVARQLQAVYKAIFNAKQLLIRDHIDHCLSEQAIQGRSSIDIRMELAEITKYL